jgi:hypothetical protein
MGIQVRLHERHRGEVFGPKVTHHSTVRAKTSRPSRLGVRENFRYVDRPNAACELPLSGVVAATPIFFRGLPTTPAPRWRRVRRDRGG